MPRASHRAVGIDEEPPNPVPTTIEEAAEAGDDLSELKLTRRAIAKKLDDPNCPARDMASLSKRLMEIGKEISAIEARRAAEAQEARRRDSRDSRRSFDSAAI
jgi:hypothetical protein